MRKPALAGRHELLDEERIPSRSGEDRRDKVGRWSGVGDPGQEQLELAVVECRQLDGIDPFLTSELRDQGT